jgi:predicted alpha/beta hydrolase
MISQPPYQENLSERSCAIPALDGLPLGATLFEPVTPRGRKAVLIASATGVKRERYRQFAMFLASRGWSAITFDYRGIGDSRTGHVKALPHTMSEWGSKDIAGVIDWIENNWAPSNLVVVAHSVGGQVLPFAPNHDRVRALLTIGCQKGYWKLWSGLDRYRCLAFWLLMPILVRALGYMPMGFVDCEDLPPRVALEWCRWGLNHDFVDENGFSLNQHHAAFRAPILAYSFADDTYAPRRAVDKILEFYRGAAREHRHIDARQLGATTIGHSGFFTDPVSAPLWHDACEWLSRSSAPLERPDDANSRTIESTRFHDAGVRRIEV